MNFLLIYFTDEISSISLLRLEVLYVLDPKPPKSGLKRTSVLAKKKK